MTCLLPKMKRGNDMSRLKTENYTHTLSYKSKMIKLCSPPIVFFLVFFIFPTISFSSVGQGCFNAYHIDLDCDGYGVGPGLSGPDADDTDATVNTWATVESEYGGANDHATITNYLVAVKGFTPADIYYLDTNNGNDSTAVVNDPYHPWESWGTVLAMLGSDDVMMVKSGEHFTQWGFSTKATGTTGHPAWVLGWPGSETKLTCNLSGGGYIMRNTGDSAHVRIEDFVLDKTDATTGQGISTATGTLTDVRFKNISVHGGDNGVYMFNAMVDVTWENLVTYDHDVHGFYIGARAVDSNGDVTSPANKNIRLKLINVLSYNGGSSGVQHNGIQEDSVWDRVVSHSNNGIGIAWLSGSTNSTLKNSLSFNNEGVPFSINTYVDTTPYPYKSNGNLVINNTFWEGYGNHEGTNNWPSGQACIKLFDEDTGFDQGHNTFRNNICVLSGATSNYAYFVATRLEDWVTTSTFENNIYYNASGSHTEYVTIDPTLQTAGTLVGLTAFNAMTNNSGNIYVNPLFTNVSTAYNESWGNFDFSLASGSPAIDGSNETSAPTIDILYENRDSRVDIGAYEYQNKVLAPSNLGITINATLN